MLFAGVNTVGGRRLDAVSDCFPHFLMPPHISAAVTTLESLGANVNARDHSGEWTPLMIAAAHGDYPMVRVGVATFEESVG